MFNCYSQYIWLIRAVITLLPVKIDMMFLSATFWYHHLKEKDKIEQVHDVDHARNSDYEIFGIQRFLLFDCENGKGCN